MIARCRTTQDLLFDTWSSKHSGTDHGNATHLRFTISLKGIGHRTADLVY